MERLPRTLGALALGAVATVVASNHGPADAATRAAIRMPQAAPVPPRLVHFKVRPYTIGGQTINIFIGPPLCGGNSGGYGLASGLNSELWYTIYGNGCSTASSAVVSLTTAGVATVYLLSGSLLGLPTEITESADKAHMWFVGDNGSDALASITPSGGVTPYPVPNRPLLSGIISGPDSRLYFGINYGAIGAITEAGVVKSYPLAAGGDLVTGLTVGNDGNIWFSNANVNGLTTGGVGKITTGGAYTEYNVGFQTNGIATGADKNIWFTSRTSSTVGFVPYTGTPVTTFSAGISGSPNQIVTGPDGNEYFDETVSGTSQSAIAKITTNGVVTEYPLPYGFTPSAITVGPDSNIWVMDSSHDELGQLVLPKATPTPTPTAKPTSTPTPKPTSTPTPKSTSTPLPKGTAAPRK